jgi:hypothetical protein
MTGRIKKNKNNDVEIWTEEQYEEYLRGLYGMEFIAGFTEGGVPYGLFIEDEDTYLPDESEMPADAEGPDGEFPFCQ